MSGGPRFVPFDPTTRERWEERVARELVKESLDLQSLARRLPGGLVIEPLYTDVPDAEPVPPGPFGAGERPAYVQALLAADADTTLGATARAAAAAGADRLWLEHGPLAARDANVDLAGQLATSSVPIDLEVWPADLDLLDTLRSFGVPLEAACDPFSWVAREGEPLTGLGFFERRFADLVREAPPGARPLRVDARTHHEAGANAVQELGAAMATAIAQLRILERNGISLEDATSRMRFSMSVDADFVVSIAKLRAARLLWAKVQGALGVASPDPMRIHAFASLRDRDPARAYDDVLRDTVAGFSAILGGADRITLAPFEPSPRAERLSRNTFLVLRHEAHLDAVRDAAAGSYAIEHLTQELARRGWDTMRWIESQGGMGPALTSGAWRDSLLQEATAEEAGG
ncbi:MAG: methylmalonyl-CoA mutase family protein [Sandaracinaceae bacterium]